MQVSGVWCVQLQGGGGRRRGASATDDNAEPEACEALIRGILIRTIDATGYLAEADEAVAAAALIAAQCPEGEPVDTPYGPETPMPIFPTALRALADEALACIVGDDAESASKWVAQEDWKQWRAMRTRLRAVLAPPPPSSLSSMSSLDGVSLGTEVERRHCCRAGGRAALLGLAPY
ncbi:DUF4259 domain-containing protein [Streptomyces sp. NBC_00271]|uniref:DUF4259 domain-containing protein n=1 Tax=Streptomyces sp. NBC_00271 TaxID=2975697 RepID=UPI002E2D362C|nr:DUF4259 domain-containing protein [Streptomyces sp. NBC_00271]